MSRAREFSLPNVGPGPDPFSLSALPDEDEFVVLFFQRDYYCTKCRGQVQELADRIDEFRERDAAVVSVVPEPVERVESWQGQYDLPFPLLADPDASVGEAYGQPVRFGPLGRISDFFGRMPEVVIVDRRVDPPDIAYTHRGRSTFDRPSVDDLLSELDALRSEE
ncbi:MAG: redoxin domain-containing protein [Haloferacaceae archaeon]